ncbi:MAG: 1-deoxy-D-xylulose-5-phosphate synthase [Firmicutes bacterium]|nr:1-deoxy-D-xylulose-5-phosphate synthase [Bacillota bacterium]
MNDYLRGFTFPDDLKKMSYDELELLSYELRDFIVESVSETGGHLSSNLGIVEITIALHKCFDAPYDKIIFDVGHQTYIHKILTGRIDGFSSLRKMGGISGFPKKSESEFDLFDTGHSSNSISLGLGMAAARDIKNEKNKVVSVIGDGAMTGGLAFEALNNAGNMNTDLIVLLNDNGMSISGNTGGLSKSLGRITSAENYIHAKTSVKKGLSKVPVFGEGVISGIHKAKESIKYAVIDGIIFEELGLKYLGPINGHDIKEMCETLERAKSMEGPVLIHAVTKKGKGYSKAEEKPNVFHGIGPFNPETGETKASSVSYSSVFGRKLSEMTEDCGNLVAITAAMTDGVGLKDFAKKYPNRIYDVGIAEEHAVSFAAGLAKGGLKPFVAIYSTFLQRSYDEIIEDVCLQKLPVVLCIDRAGVVGADGETHHGIFDLAYLKSMPGIEVMAPRDEKQLCEMMEYAYSAEVPCAIRYPRGKAISLDYEVSVAPGKAQVLRDGEDVAIWAVGAMVKPALDAAEILEEKGISAAVIDPVFTKPADETLIREMAAGRKLTVTVEDGVVSGGFGETVAGILSDSACRTVMIGWPDKFIEHGTQEQLYKKYGLDAEGIAERIIIEKEA